MSQFRQNIELLFPALGVDRSMPEQSQRPFTCREAINVRPQGPIDRRDRGGSRPGMSETVRSDGTFVGPPRMMATVDLSPDFTGTQSAGIIRRSAFDGFEGPSGSPFAADWIIPIRLPFASSAASIFEHREVDGNGEAFITGFTIGGAPQVTFSTMVRAAYPDMNTAQAYRIGMRFLPAFDPLNNRLTFDTNIFTSFSLLARIPITTIPQDTYVKATIFPQKTESPTPTNPSPPHNYPTEITVESGGIIHSRVSGTTIPTRSGPHGGLFTLTVDTSTAPLPTYTMAFDGEEVYSAQLGPDLAGFGTHFGFMALVRGLFHGIDEDVNPKARVASWQADFVESVIRQPVRERRRVLIASDGAGQTWEEQLADRPDLIVQEGSGNDTNLRSDVQLAAQQHNQRLFIADHGPIKFRSITGVIDTKVLTIAAEIFPIKGTADNQIDLDNDVVFLVSALQDTAMPGGYKIVDRDTDTQLTLEEHPDSAGAATTLSSVEFVIVRSPKVYDPRGSTDSKLSIWVSELDGTVPKGGPPVGCHIIAPYNDRIVMAGFPSNVWYMSRQGNPYDWAYDFAGAETDYQRPMISTATESGRVGEPLSGAIPHSFDYFLFTTKSQIWWMRGDPAAGGRLENISFTIGMVDQEAYAHGPDNVLIFLGLDGIYGIPATAGALPQSLSRNRLPRELIEVDTNQFQVTLAYDVERAGVHIYVTPRDTSVFAQHWWMDWGTKGFYRVRLDPERDPFQVLSLSNVDLSQRGVLIGCRDGKFRTYDDAFQGDDDDAFQSEVWYGPFRLGGSERTVGILAEMQGTLDDESSPVTWEVYVGDTAASAFLSSPHSTGTWLAGVNSWVRPRAKGSVAFLRLLNRDQGRWAIETIALRRKLAGRRKSGEGMVRRAASQPATFAAGR